MHQYQGLTSTPAGPASASHRMRWNSGKKECVWSGDGQYGTRVHWNLLHPPRLSTMRTWGIFFSFSRRTLVPRVSPNCDHGSMSMSSRCKPCSDPLERATSSPGGNQRGRCPTTDPQEIERVSGARSRIDDVVVRQGFDKILKELEGLLVPACTCGWCGVAEPWTTPGQRSWDGGYPFSSHTNGELMRLATQKFAASYAAAELRHAAEAWTDGDEGSRWLEERAEHIEPVGVYDGKRWP